MRPGADHVAAVGLADALVAQAHAEDRRRRAPSRSITSSDTPASFGVHGPGEITMRSGASAVDLVHRQLVVAHHLHLGAQRLQVLHEVVGEAVVVVDHQQHGISSACRTHGVDAVSRWNGTRRSRGCGATARRQAAVMPRARHLRAVERLLSSPSCPQHGQVGDPADSRQLGNCGATSDTLRHVIEPRAIGSVRRRHRPCLPVGATGSSPVRATLSELRRRARYRDERR